MIHNLLNNKRFRLVVDFVGIALGATIAAFAIEEFLVPCTILDGGVVGIGIMINNLTHLTLSILTVVFNIPFLIIGSPAIIRTSEKSNKRVSSRRMLWRRIARSRGWTCNQIRRLP